MPILLKAGDRPVTATTLNNIGEVYRNLKQPQKALEFYNQALPIYKEVGDISGEAVSLNNIGLVYYQSKQQEQALTYYNQALPIVKKSAIPEQKLLFLAILAQSIEILIDLLKRLKI